MYAGCLLLVKGMLINKNCVSSLQSKINIFQIENFNDFVDSSTGQKLLQNFVTDRTIYETFYSQMVQKLTEEI
jgi:hypothetical protein